jgi:hypothetical protein
VELSIRGYGIFVNSDMLAFSKVTDDAERIYSDFLAKTRDTLKIGGGSIEISMWHIDGFENGRSSLVCSDTITRIK